MDSNFQDKIMSILNNPEGLEKILSIAGSLGGKKETAIPATATEVENKAGEEKSVQTVAGFDLSEIEKLYNHGKSERMELLNALRPYIKSDKKDKIDSIVRAIKTIDLIYSAKNLL